LIGDYVWLGTENPSGSIDEVKYRSVARLGVDVNKEGAVIGKAQPRQAVADSQRAEGRRGSSQLVD
jgi:hypothetical protein